MVNPWGYPQITYANSSPIDIYTVVCYNRTMTIQEYRRLVTKASHWLGYQSNHNPRFERGPCVVCRRRKVDGHHEDYRRPDLITWMCHKHHRRHHAGKPKNWQWLGTDSGLPS